MSYNEYVNAVKTNFKKLKSNLTETEVNNYFSESETIDELKEGYEVYSRNNKIGHPMSKASNLVMMY